MCQAEVGMYRMLRGEDVAEGWGAWVKGDTLTSGVYESREYQRTTAGCLEYEIEGGKKRRRVTEKEMRMSESARRTEVKIQA